MRHHFAEPGELAEPSELSVKTDRARLWAGRRMLFVASMSLGSLLWVTTAHARPDPIPAPVEEPDEEESPGTGQEAPDDPEDPEPIEPPEGLECTEDPTEDSCDPDHPGGPEGQLPNNTPGDAWYNDMAAQMYGLQESLDELADWGSSYDPYIYYFSTWTKTVVQQYYALGYQPNGSPRQYSYGRMTRGDFNYYLYYWVRPLYYSLLYYSSQYYESHQGHSQIPYYRQYLSQVSESYQSLVLCNYGFNGDDDGSREDLHAYTLEEEAGLDD